MGWILGALSGILAGFSYPTVLGGHLLPDLGWLAYFAWVPLFIGIAKATPGRAFLAAACAGIFHYSISMYWLYTALNSFGHLPAAISVLVLFLLIAILSAHFGLIFYFSRWISLRLGISESLLRPVVWVAIEYMRGHFPMGGLPWSQIAYSQGHFLTVLQFADLAGVYGVTFLLVFLNEVVAQVLRFLFKKERPDFSFPITAAALVVWASALGYGHHRLRDGLPAPDASLPVGIVQGNVPQDEKWNRQFVRKILDTYRDGTLALQAQGAKLVLWPEASFPLSVFYDLETLPLQWEGMSSDLLFGAISRSQAVLSSGKRQSHNSALLMDSQSRKLDYYHKRHLVPFGEYIPWKDLLFFAKKLTAEVGDIVPGESYRPMRYRDKLLGVLICYEDIFPEISRIMTADGAQALINLTNDAWYGRSSAAYQHQVFSQFRAVETRRALVRATNTGLSSLIDRQGRVLWQGNLFERQDFLTELPLYHDRSPYVRIGDLFPIVCLGASGVALLISMLKKKRI